MLKQRHEQIQFMVRTTDIVVTIVSFYAAYALRGSLFVDEYGKLDPLETHLWILATSIAIHLFIYQALGFYQSLRMKSAVSIVGMVLKSFLIEILLLGSMVFFLQQKTTSRYFVVLFVTINACLILIEKIGARVLLSSIRSRGYNHRRVLIVGTGLGAQKVFHSLKRHRHWGYLPTAFLFEKGAEQEDQVELLGLPILGGIDQLEKVVVENAIDEVYLAAESWRSEDVALLLSLCEKIGIPLRLSLGIVDFQHSKFTFSNLDDVPVITFYTILMTPIETWIKRAMDIVVSLVGLLITGALYPWISYRIRKESPGPVIFKQIRVGENGRRFKCYKFRSMDLDAEAKKAELAAKNQLDGPVFKMEKDPRVFPFGEFLRKSSLDELPQFLNILRGDMSVVGTRPPTPDEVLKYETHYRRRLSIRPGLTGLWQVSGRNHVRNFEDILALDLKYIDHFSIWLDIRIIMKTVWVTLFGRGAY